MMSASAGPRSIVSADYLADQLAMYGTLPGYRAVLDAEGVAATEDLLIAGDEATAEAGLCRYADAGATDARVSILSGNADEDERSRALLRRQARTPWA